MSPSALVALFDLDGTLLDTPRPIARAISKAVEDATGARVAAADIMPLIGLALPEIASRLAHRIGLPTEDSRIQDAYLARFETDVLPDAASMRYPRVEECLNALRREDVRVGVVTNKNHRNAARILHAAGLMRHLDLVIGADQVTAPKPAPDGILLAIERAGGSAERTFYIGDSPSDMTAASDAGAHPIGIGHDPTDNSRLIDAGAAVAVRSLVDACIIGCTAAGVRIQLSA